MHKVTPIPAFDDNYIWLIHGRSEEYVAIVDPGDEGPVIRTIEENRLIPTAILCTHRHYDHVDGIGDLVDRYDIPAYGPARENITRLTHRVSEGDEIDLPALGLLIKVLDVPGHTAGHVAFLAQDMLFCGDTLFSAGCGRLFDGTAEQLFGSLGKFATLPGETRIFPAHEYTMANLRFALAVEPKNPSTRAYVDQVKELRSNNLPSLPSLLSRERQINPFLRASEPTVQEAVSSHTQTPLTSPEEVFAALRRWKDHF